MLMIGLTISAVAGGSVLYSIWRGRIYFKPGTIEIEKDRWSFYCTACFYLIFMAFGLAVAFAN